MSASASFLIVQHAWYHHGFYDVILDWVALNLPEERSCFELRDLPCAGTGRGTPALLVPWLQDPVENWSRRTYRQALALTARCDAQGIPVLNRVEHLARAGKCQGAEIIGATGLRTPKVRRIADVKSFRADFLGLPFPFFVREELGHGSDMLRVNTAAEARALSLRPFQKPLAVELIDLPDPRDGLYRKYRYVVAGDFGVPHHLQASPDWVTRGADRVSNATTRAEELAYIESPCPHHDAFQKARRALRLDFVAFDYSLDGDGNPVVWEANPYPTLKFSYRGLVYRNESLHRTLVILLATYYQRAGLPLPSRLSDYLASCPVILPSKRVVTESHEPEAVETWQCPPPQPKLRLSAWQRLRRSLNKAIDRWQQ